MTYRDVIATLALLSPLGLLAFMLLVVGHYVPSPTLFWLGVLFTVFGLALVVYLGTLLSIAGSALKQTNKAT
jgi:hypothetical protein